MQIKRNLSMNEYLASPGMSCSELLARRRSLAYADWYRTSPSKGSRFTLKGSAYHCLAIEEAEFWDRYEVVGACMTPKKGGAPCQNPGIKVGGVCGVHGRGQPDAENMLTEKEMGEVKCMAASVQDALRDFQILDREVSWFSGDRRARPDLVCKHGERKVIVDLKSEGYAAGFARRQAYAGIHVRAAWYLDFDPSVDAYIVALTASDAPFETWLMEVPEQYVEAGRREIERLMEIEDPRGVTPMELPAWVLTSGEKEDVDFSEVEFDE